MIFSHISDTHLGLVQYGSEEREQDVYHAFNQAIDTSIKDHVDFVIFAGDIFHFPNPNGTAIVQMANALKRLKQNKIDSFFVLGEHDISRIRTTPIPYVYHNLEFSRYIGQGKPIKYKNILLAGFDKMRKSEILQFEEKFSEIDEIAKNHSGHKILVLHQGITEFNKSVNEISEKLVNFERKPIVELKIHGEKIETEVIQAQISRLNSLSLRCFWNIINKEGIDSSVFLERPNMIDEELFRLSIDALGSEQLASFAVKELLPLLSSKQLKDATQIVIEDYKRFKKEKQK